MNERQTFGQAGERFAARWLLQEGFTILAYNFHARTGEVDIIARRHEVVAFVEVKTRTNAYFHLSNVITKSKQRSIISAAKCFILKQGWASDSYVYRFDVALIERYGDSFEINYIANAFGEE